MARHSASKTKDRVRARATVGHGPLDMVHLAKQTLGDKGLEQEVLRVFDDASRTYFSRIETSTNVEDLMRHLHTLSAAAAGVGARAIAELARTTEEELRQGSPVDPERIEDLHMAVVECSQWIERVLPKDS
jgi:HPt (histidine-containing phosphotransfer) domain-containing protein